MRLVLFRITDERPLVHPPIPEREIDPASLSPSQTQKRIVGSPPFAHVVDAPVKQNGHADVTGPSNGHKRPTLESVPKTDAALRQWLASRALAFDDLRRPELLVRRTGGAGRVAELLWILRPVIYGALARPSCCPAYSRKEQFLPLGSTVIAISLRGPSRSLSTRCRGSSGSPRCASAPMSNRSPMPSEPRAREESGRCGGTSYEDRHGRISRGARRPPG